MLEEFNDNPELDNANDTSGLPDDSFVVSEKKPISKFNIIGFFGIVAALGFLLIMHLRGPSTATAAPAQTAQANQTISQFLSGGANNIRDMQTSLQNTEKQVHIFENYPSVRQVPLGNLKTNPFAYRSDDKSAAEAARKLAEQEAEIQKAAKDMKLQSIMYSNRPQGHSACMINNALCSVGEQVGGFTIEKINPNSVVMHQGSLQFELKIQK